jgi:hypothetical protein
MTNIKTFETYSDYLLYKNSSEYISPNISFIIDERTVKYNKKYIKAGDVVYKKGDRIDTIPLDQWSDDMGTPFGVVVIPSYLVPDERCRIIPLFNRTESASFGSAQDIPIADTYGEVPITMNDNSTTISSHSFGYLPSDTFSGEMSITDNNTYYYYDNKNQYIPSILLSNDKLNKNALVTLSGKNLLSDFDGEGNTEMICSYGETYQVAHLARNFDDTVTNIKYYLPSIGEVAIMLARLDEISKTLIYFNNYTRQPYTTVVTSTISYPSYMQQNREWYINLSVGLCIHNTSDNGRYFVMPMAKI